MDKHLIRRREAARIGALRVALIVTLSILAGCGGETLEPVDKRLIVLGFDGMDPVLAQRWMDEGLLPNFSRLAAQGDFSPLGTSNPPQSPVAWASFATGSNPGHHGIFDFLRRHPETYTPDFSISKAVQPTSFFPFFGFKIPLNGGETINRRVGEPFWMTAEAAGHRAAVMRVPVTFPPDPIHRMVSGMGVPDLLGTQGTYTLYTTRRIPGADTGGRVIRVKPARSGGSIEAEFEGPPHPMLDDGTVLSVPLTMTPEGDRVVIDLDGATADLGKHEWSDWLPVEFDFFGFMSVSGMVRVYLVEEPPRLQLYVSPIHFDPKDPAVAITSPPEYAEGLASRIGRFHTIGMPEETWSLNQNHVPDSAFLDMIKATLAEREAMFYDELEQNLSDLVVAVFVQTDRVSHMFWRGFDPKHPLYGDTDEQARQAIPWIYQEADRILGEAMRRMGPEDEIMVISDHGFAPFYRAVHLNRWLIDNGFMTLKEGRTTSGQLFADVDWSRTRAYATGLNGLYINRADREGEGIVPPAEVDSVKRELMNALQTFTDPDSGEPVISRVFDGARIYAGAFNSDAPDLVPGYQRGYRASWQTTLGGAPKALVEPNLQNWSGDHCIDPALVPGVFFSSFTPEQEVGGIEEIARMVLERMH